MPTNRFSISPSERFGRLVVTTLHGYSKYRQAIWECLCDCGRTAIVRGSDLRVGDTRSCGCLRREVSAKRQTTHGMKQTPEYNAWRAIIQRCYNVNNPRYKDWGGRGITIFGEWRNDFLMFYTYIGSRPSSQHTIDRYPNNNGNYEP